MPSRAVTVTLPAMPALTRAGNPLTANELTTGSAVTVTTAPPTIAPVATSRTVRVCRPGVPSMTLKVCRPLSAAVNG
jgi:hypothetical protein